MLFPLHSVQLSQRSSRHGTQDFHTWDTDEEFLLPPPRTTRRRATRPSLRPCHSGRDTGTSLPARLQPDAGGHTSQVAVSKRPAQATQPHSTVDIREDACFTFVWRTSRHITVLTPAVLPRSSAAIEVLRTSSVSVRLSGPLVHPPETNARTSSQDLTMTKCHGYGFTHDSHLHLATPT